MIKSNIFFFELIREFIKFFARRIKENKKELEWND